MKDIEEKAESRLGGIFAIVLAYALFSTLWILLSDSALGLLIRDPDTFLQASMVKGWFFVAVTTTLLYFLVRRLLRHVDDAHRREIAALEDRQKTLAGC
ncbi:MAG TPA: hypothetical protein PKK30_17915 [Nitrospira sp.]|nr:hypothetical protein [Nitrospira sp.]